MATLSNLTGFVNGAISDQKILGNLNNAVHHLRYQLHIDASESGSELAVKFGGKTDSASIGWVPDGGTTQQHFDSVLNKELKFCCAISDDKDAYADVSNAPTDFPLIIQDHPWGGVLYTAKCDSIKHYLLPGKTYYLWLYPIAPYTTGRLQWVDGCEKTLTISGDAGIAWIKTKNGLKPAVPYVRQSGKWKRALPYVRNKGAWSIGTGQ